MNSRLSKKKCNPPAEINTTQKSPHRLTDAGTLLVRLFFRCHAANCQRFRLHSEPDLHAGKGEAVYPFRVVLVGRAGILGQNCAERIPLFFRQEL